MRPQCSNIAVIAISAIIYLFTLQYYNNEVTLLKANLANQARQIQALIAKDSAPPIANEQIADNTPISNESYQRRKSSICMLSMFHKKDLAELMLPYFLEYSNHWGYPFFFYHSNKYASSMESYKFKIRLIERYFNYCEWIAWFDSDIIITNFSIPLDSFIDNRYEFLASGPSANGEWSLNAGLMFVRGSDWTRDLFQKVYQLTAYDDQAALELLLSKQENKNKAKIIPWKQLQQPYAKNRVGQWMRGDFSIHFWGPEKMYITEFLEQQKDFLNSETYSFEPFSLGKNRKVEKWPKD